MSVLILHREKDPYSKDMKTPKFPKSYVKCIHAYISFRFKQDNRSETEQEKLRRWSKNRK